ncbi:hypothetical protein QFZ82_001476 [Streptomyces sp. V4I23]|nr:hypothetical protein [Streptomyces sp. V4I23]
MALLRRTAGILAPHGRLIAEAAAVEVDERCEVRLDDGRGGPGTRFPWARVGPEALLRHAGRAGWAAAHVWSAAGRHFAELVPALSPPSGSEGRPGTP